MQYTMRRQPLRSDTAYHAIYHLAIPLKSWLQRFSAFLFMMISLGLVILGKLNYPALEQARIRMTESLVPVVNALAKPIDTVIDMGKSVNELLYIRQENIFLRAEMARLQQESLKSRQIGIENTQLRQLLNFVDVVNNHQLSARVVSDATSPYMRTVIINTGSNGGVRKGQVVVNEKGLIGRIIEVGKNHARILLVTDINSRVPIIMERSRERGILAGDNTENPDLLYLPRESKAAEGELVITSGDGKQIPPGLPVGQMYKEDGRIKMRPLVEWHRLEYVSIVN